MYYLIECIYLTLSGLEVPSYVGEKCDQRRTRRSEGRIIVGRALHTYIHTFTESCGDEHISGRHTVSSFYTHKNISHPITSRYLSTKTQLAESLLVIRGLAMA